MSAVIEKTMSDKRVFSVNDVRADFPILHQKVNAHPLVYLDNAATTQKPNAVLDAIVGYYEGYNANVHRGAHSLSDKATQAFESARETVARFINSPSSDQIIWTRGTTEGVNLVAQTWGRSNIASGDKILVPELEHHSNIVPWQMLAAEKGAQLIPLPIREDGDIDLAKSRQLFDKHVKLLAVNHVSNALGTINPIPELIEMAHAHGAKVLVDGAQAVAHFPLDIQDLGADFYVFSGHKLYGPTGIGVLWGKKELLESMPPYHFGGEMIERVSFAETTFNKLPYKFEAGTPDIAGAIGLAAAIDYLCSFDREQIQRHENALLEYALQRAEQFPNLKRVGRAKHVAAVLGFVIEGTHPADIGTLLDQQGIAVRTGHHCAQPLMDRYHLPGSVRASFAMYNTQQEIDRLFEALQKVMQFLS